VARLVASLNSQPGFLEWLLAPAIAARYFFEGISVGLIVAPAAQRYLAVGLLLRVWGLGKKHSKEGFLKGMDFDALNNLIGVPGFSETLSSVGSGVDQASTQGVGLPEWTKHNGRNRRKRRDQPLPEASEYPWLKSCEFRKAWEEWLAYRRERSLTITGRTLRAQLKFLSTLSLIDSIKCMHQSISNGWQGLCPLKGGENDRTNSSGRGAKRPGRVEAAPGKYDHLSPNHSQQVPLQEDAQPSLFPGEGAQP
jgi:hypothetical protein